MQKVSVQQGVATKGALLYRPGHIAVSLGNGQTIEARGKAYGVGSWAADSRGWTQAGLVPGLDYTKKETVVPEEKPPVYEVFGRVVGLVVTPTGEGYYLVTDRGEVVNFGDAKYLGAVTIKP